MAKFVRYVKDFWKVYIRGENHDLQRQTIRMEEELARLRMRRMASEKEREAAALNEARNAVQKIRELHDNLLAAEKAAAQFAARLGETAKSTMEAHAQMRQESNKKFFTYQKQQVLAEQFATGPEAEKHVPVIELNEQRIESTEIEEKKFGAADDTDTNNVRSASLPDEKDQGQLLSHVSKFTSVRNGDLNNDGISPSDAAASMVANDAEVLDEVSPEAMEEMLEAVRNQLRLEEKSHVDALSREKAMLEKRITTQDTEEHNQQQRGQC
ncbi:hypothetical protein KP509_21G028900 [Ceratopteris richardii]|uniref:Uncharacterized protein n=1 Tax=Ceratopteris richardii TaxID=49495 RepID=A0A8T2SAH6_CERRI|nr:hypothetical protein KP509_21G028900 [Ceratopteris richardii]